MKPEKPISILVMERKFGMESGKHLGEMRE